MPHLILCVAAFVSSFVVAVGGGRRDTPALYKADTGPFPVRSVIYVVLRDQSRDKDLPVSAYFPARPRGKLPVIVFSHGGGGSGETGLPLVRHWASHGYLVLCPTHGDSLRLRFRQGKDISDGMRGVVRRALTRQEDWLNRPKDISFLLDSLAAIEARIPALRGRLNAKRLGVGGHSFGAFTAQAIAGATIKLSGHKNPLSLADNRPKAILLLSPQGRGQMGLHEHSWDAIKRPVMTVAGSLDRGAMGQPPSWRCEPFHRSPPGEKFLLFIQGAHHGSFTGLYAENPRPLFRRSGGDQKAIFQWVKAATTAFWDAYLTGDKAALDFLRSDALEAATRSLATLRRR